MKENEMNITKIFENTNIRTKWDSEKEDYYFCVVDVIEALTESKNPNDYWYRLKKRMSEEERSEISTKCRQLKIQSSDGKFYKTDTLDTKGILRLIQSVPSPKAEPFKLWLSELGKERIDEIYDPEIAINRAINYYRKKGYNDDWIDKRLNAILHRNQLTEVWKNSGIKEPLEYAILTNEIYKEWSGMKANEYKEFKGIRKESLRDNMTEIEVLLTDLGELATKELTKELNPYGIEESKKVAKRGGRIAKNTKENLEKELNKKVIVNTNNINGRYLN